MTDQNSNKIYIVGAGAIGKVLAVLLKREGKNVTILRGSVDDRSSHIEKIEVEVKGKDTLEAEVEVSTISHFSNLDGMVVLTNKSFGNPRLAETLKARTGQSPVVILQNGLNVEQPFIDAGFPQLYRCVLFATSQTVGNKVKYKPVAVSPVGVIKGKAESLPAIVGELNTSLFQFRAEPDILPVIWTKAIVNSVFNSICPLLETDNGIFHRNETALAMAKRVITECVSVARAKGVSLDTEQVVNSLLMISKASDGQLISTYQDILNKRRTEIDTLNFAIVEVAKELNKEGAVTETKLLGELTRLKSELNQ